MAILTNASVPYWNGRPLGNGLVVIGTEHRGLASNGRHALRVSACDAVFRIGAEQIAPFLECHRHRVFVCDDAGSVYWGLVAELRAISSQKAVGQLRRIVEDGRFIDVAIWQNLVELAHDGYGERNSPTVASGDFESIASRIAGLLAATSAALKHPVEIFPSSAIWLGQKFATKTVIAFGRMPPLQFIVSPDDRKTAVDRLESKRLELANRVKQHSELFQCFRRTNDSIKFHNGLPDYHSKRLKALLQRRWNGLFDAHDYPIPAPHRDGEISADPQDWGRLAHCDEELELWATLERLCRAMKLVRELLEEPLAVDYRLVPRLRLVHHGLAELVGHGWLSSTPGSQFLLIEFPDLEARCLAATCRSRFNGSALADAAVREENLHSYVSGLLNWSSLASSLSPAHDAERAAAALIYATGLKLGDRAAEALVCHTAGADLTRSAIREIRERLIEAFPELDDLECETAEIVRYQLRLREGAWNQPARSATIALHRAIYSAGWESFYALVGAHLANPQVSHLLTELQRGIAPDKLAEDLLAETRHTATGRLRGQCRLEKSTAEYLDLADDVIKSLLFEISHELGYPVGFITGTILAQVPETVDVAQLQQQVQGIADVVGGHLLQMPLSCKIDLARRF